MSFTLRRALLVLSFLCVLSVPDARAQPVPDTTPAELLGRWSLIAVIRDGEDVTRNGVTQVAIASTYDFKDDGTFTIAVGERTLETGSWSADPTTVPKIFDHVPNLPNGRRPRVPGIYEVGGDALKMCLFPASEANTHPTKCEAKAANRSSIYIFKRAAK